MVVYHAVITEPLVRATPSGNLIMIDVDFKHVSCEGECITALTDSLVLAHNIRFNSIKAFVCQL